MIVGDKVDDSDAVLVAVELAVKVDNETIIWLSDCDEETVTVMLGVSVRVLL